MDSLDTSWIDLRKGNSAYYDGCMKFLELAKKSLVEGKTRYPCNKCKINKWYPIDEVGGHILFNGFYRNYRDWIFHYEGEGSNTLKPLSDHGKEVAQDDMDGLLREAFGVRNPQFTAEFQGPSLSESDFEDEGSDDMMHEEFDFPCEVDEENPASTNSDEEVAKYKRLMEASNEGLYVGCTTFSKLSILLHLFHLKCMFHWCAESFNKLLELLNDAFPLIKEFPSSYYEGMKIIKDLGLGYEKIHACPNNCMLYWGEFADETECHKCNTSRWKTVKGMEGETIEKGKETLKKGEPAKVMRYFPLIPRLKRLYMSSKTAEDMRWHFGRADDTILRHPADGEAWKKFDKKYKEFSADPRSVRLGFASDGFNPYRLMNANYSTWPVVSKPSTSPDSEQPLKYPATRSNPSTSYPNSEQPLKYPITNSNPSTSSPDSDQPQYPATNSNPSTSPNSNQPLKYPAANSNSHDLHEKREEQPDVGHNEASNKGSKPLKSLRSKSHPDWPMFIDFDDKEEVMTIDANGHIVLLSGYIQPIDVWSNNGVRFYVEFNDLYQPIRKGGHILIRFLGSIAKIETYCPVGELNWHDLDQHFKKKIIKEIRDRFVIPEGELYNKAALKHVNKSWRQYKFTLKRDHYKPEEKSLEEMCNAAPPHGISSQNWVKLLKYWDSETGKTLAACGKAAQANLNQLHRSGCKSFANRQADYEDEHGEKMSLLALWIQAHTGKDGSFLPGTVTEDFVDDAKAKVEELRMLYPSKSQQELEDEAFEQTMHGGEIPDRPIGYGLGVRKIDIYGVHALLRKDGSRKIRQRTVVMDNNVKEEVCALQQKNEVLEKENEKLKDQVQENNNLLKTLIGQFSQVVGVVCEGKSSTGLMDCAKSILGVANQQGPVTGFAVSSPSGFAPNAPSTMTTFLQGVNSGYGCNATGKQS